MLNKGKAHVVGDDVNTDYIIASKYRSLGLDFKEMAKHLFEDLDPQIVQRIHEGDFIVAGKNFGCGSSREFAPRVIQAIGVKAIIASSYARIFYRNSFNIGLLLLESETKGIKDQDDIELDLDNWVARIGEERLVIPINPLPPFILKIIKDGGLVNHFRKQGGFEL
jgi:3-isopropylmalate/(R)-2-methylmalate dehydratase small subunit